MRILPSNQQPPAAPSGGGEGGDGTTLHHDAVTRRALNALVSSSEQTYEQFLRGFTHLTATDVAPSIIHDAYGDSEDPPLFMAPVQPPRLPSPPLASNCPRPSTDGIDDLEEEILDSSRQQDDTSAGPVDVPPKRILKMDNFVDDEESADSADDDDSIIESVGSEYIASFSVTPDRPSTSDQCLSLSSNTSISGRSTSLSNKVHSINLVNDDTPSTPVDGDSVENDDEELLYDPSLDRPNPGEVEDDVIDTPASRAASAAMVTNLRDMAYSARPATPGEVSCSSRDAEVHAFVDEVQPFTLDEDFDYDDVILTPKFTTEEQEYLKSFAKKDKEDTEAETSKEETSEESAST